MQRLFLILLFSMLTLLPFHPSPARACQDGCNPADCSNHQHMTHHDPANMTSSETGTAGDCGSVDCPHHREALQDRKNFSASSKETALDPICGMRISKEASAAQVKYKGKTYYFCKPGEKETFLKDPEKYLGHP